MQLAGQKSIVTALLNITYITQTLLNDRATTQQKDTHQSSRDRGEARPNRLREESEEEYKDKYKYK